MKILVELPEWQYKEIKGDKGISEGVMINALCAIRLGKPVEQEPRKGHWIDEGIYADGQSYHAFMCSECGWHHIENKSELVDFKYCPFCRADMREVEE